ncbi:MAG: aldo/keto reductase [Chelatococcus sp.]|uniref:aldo/keto reductase n=1 Tax=unclassified Chelatococcus TaxID=2638111 RepID=UPI001BCF6BA3|nr:MULTISPECIES: aldo/keto reductase [unclassified Chelatococcus]CAH1658162.1 Protein tas [Hyphomicrobiales bacterium]MBS7740772.1 aldo/keto reductase [Chelatococcus sp. HY11]MBX3537030.1 aldo/keto reductase [Chelatococcus sp.]MBX3545994.1 aldo/keto reductase [Chelatococcus sp.]MCO5079621.1 aldo/keto reductase [Chelatococcus sp.]
MRYTKLGRTGLDVSRICLGTMTFGDQNTKAEGFAQMDHAVERGINFFDTAELYSVPPKPETQGSTERIVGDWLMERGQRDKIVLATKIVGRTPNTWFREGGLPGELNRAQIHEAVDKSLKRLKTDYIDLYQLHWPDRAVSRFGSNATIFKAVEGPENPIPEILDALDDIVKAGKVRFIGLSNETPWGTMSFLHAAETAGKPRVQSIQNAYSLVNRTFELGLAEIALRENTGLLAYSPLGQGYLTGKYQNGALPKGSRKQLYNRLQRYETPGAQPAFDAYLALAATTGLDPAQMALAFVLSRPFVTAAIVGASNLDQLKTNIDAIDLALTEEIEQQINDIHLLHQNPCP